jgi:hypothetical protein
MRLSNLIPDAFRILSEAYILIGTNGSKVVDLQKTYSPSAPKKINQLILQAMLFRTIMDHVILNNNGTAIVGIVYQDVSVINDLLFQLKKSLGIYQLPVFPSPMTIINFYFGSDVDANEEVGADNVDTSGSTLVLDFDDKKIMVFSMIGTIGAQKVFSLVNAGDGLKYDFIFTIGVGGSLVIPSAQMDDSRWAQVNPNEWVPIDYGTYRGTATLSNSLWRIEISQSIYQ